MLPAAKTATRKISDLSSISRIVSIAFPNRPNWTPKVPDMPVVANVAAAVAGSGESVFSKNLWSPVGLPDDIEVARRSRKVLGQRLMSENEMEHINYGGSY